MVNPISESTEQESSFSFAIVFIICFIFTGFFFQKLALNELREAMQHYEYHQVKNWKTVSQSDHLLELIYNNSGFNAHKETPTLSIYNPELKNHVIKKQYSYLNVTLIYDLKSIYHLESKKKYKLDHAIFMTSHKKSVVNPTSSIILFIQGELLLADGNVLKIKATEYLTSSKIKAKIILQRKLFFFFMPTSILFAVLSVFFWFFRNFQENDVNIIGFVITGIALFYIGSITISKVLLPWIHLT